MVFSPLLSILARGKVPKLARLTGDHGRRMSFDPAGSGFSPWWRGNPRAVAMANFGQFRLRVADAKVKLSMGFEDSERTGSVPLVIKPGTVVFADGQM